MIPTNHTIKLFHFNPNNLKEVVSTDTFNVRYAPTNKWYIYKILINEQYCGEEVNILKIFMNINGRTSSSREKVALSIRNYINNKFEDFQDIYTMNYPNKHMRKYVKRVFNEKILNMGDFKRRDELTKYNLI